MKIFISSVISGYEAERAAAEKAIRLLGHEPVLAENFPASPLTPQAACLGALRTADLVVLIVGSRYGYPQAAGLSATHEEYRAARGTKNTVVLIQQGVDREPLQAAFLEEVQAWEAGHMTKNFTSPAELQEVLIGALHQWDMANAVAPLDPTELLARALGNLSQAGSNRSSAILEVSVAGGPAQSLLRPSEMEDTELHRSWRLGALDGPQALFDPAVGTAAVMDGDTLRIIHGDRYGSSEWVSLTGFGDVVVSQKLERPNRRSMIIALVEEDVTAAVVRALKFAAWTLEKIDPSSCLTHIAIAAQIVGGDYLGWRTRAEDDANPTSGNMGMGSNSTTTHVHLSPAHRVRAALRTDLSRISEDLTVLLRRQRGQ
ncbi:DUF4062 domain-containing protein [Rhodanobacter sp. Soil772]|uniref:DUF4062 domain-containing protein n=1 Tax=Rhodanobacter sp. Soil772 TaxID=1736406 RepID=UPI0009E7261C|nr:DUF4062 domain-containing protein [Rhodanobacter sp. Soil772]